MAKIFNLPAVGDTMVEGEIVTWFVSVGDEVELDQLICELETDKSVVEMTTPHRGTVLKLGAAVGEVVEVGTPLIIVGEPGEEIPEPEPPEPATTPTAVASAPATVPVPAIAVDGPSRPPKPSPLLRRFAHEEGVDITTVRGSGPGGRVTRADIAAAIGGDASAAPAVASTGAVRALPKVRKAAREGGIDLRTISGTGPLGSITLTDLPYVAPVRGKRTRLTAMRRAIARNLTAAAEVPQFTSMVEFDATSLLARRAALRASTDAPIPIDALLMHDLVAVLHDHRLMNAQLLGDEVEYFDSFDIGLAVDTPDGLMVPVVRSVNTLDIDALAAEIVRLAAAARDRSITPDELTGSTCTVNNIGALGIVAGTPILPLGTSTIVAFGATRPVVVMRDGEPTEIPMATMSATFDHRLIDGGDSARFLAALRTKLEA